MAITGDVKDFVIRYEGHPKYEVNRILEDDEIEVIIQKLEMILFTSQGEILGDDELGANIEYYLWKTKVSSINIRNKITEQIYRFVPELVTIGYDMFVDIYDGSYQDIMIINFIIKGYNIDFVFD